MNDDWLKLDIIGLLGLEQKLPAGEVDGVITNLANEIWYRLLNEELKTTLSEGDFKELERLDDKEKNLATLLAKISKSYPRFNFHLALVKVTSEVKKDFLTAYFEKMLEEPGSQRKESTIRELIELIKTDPPDIGKIKKLTATTLSI